MASDLIKLGGLWTNKDKNGKTYLTGKLSPTVRILIFKNEFKETENQPTHVMYLSQVEQQPQSGGSDFPPSDDNFFAGDGDGAPPPRAGARAPEDVPPPRGGAPGRGGYARPRNPVRPVPNDQYEDDLSDPFAE